RRVRRREGDRRRPGIGLGCLEGVHAPGDEHGQLLRPPAARAGHSVRHRRREPIVTRRKRNDGVEQINTSDAVAAPRAAATMEGAVPLRSLLFVPGDDERKLAKALTCAADALILDLEDSVSPARKAHAREHVAELLEAVRASRRPAGTPDDSMFARSLWVRI